MNRTNNSAGGRAVAKKPGHMSEIGRKGAAKFWQTYRLEPVDIAGWAVVRKSDNVIVNFIGSHPARRSSK